MRSILASAFCFSLISHSLARIAGHAAQAKAVEALSEHHNSKPIGPAFSCPQDNGTTISQLIDTERFDYYILCDYDFPEDDTFYKGLSYDSFSQCAAACSAADALFDESFCAVALYFDTPDDNGHNCLLKPDTTSGVTKPGVHAAILHAVAIAVDSHKPNDENKFVGINTASEDEALSSSVRRLLAGGSSTSIAVITPPPLLVQRQAPFTRFTTVINDGSTYSTGTEFHTYYTSGNSWYSAYYYAWSVAWTKATTVYAIGAQETQVVGSSNSDTTIIDQGPGGYVTVQNTTVITYTYTPTYVITNLTDTIIYSSFYHNGSFITASTTVIISAGTSYLNQGGGSGGGQGGVTGGVISGAITGSSAFLTTIATGNTIPDTTNGGNTLLPSQTPTVVFVSQQSVPSQSVPSSFLAANPPPSVVTMTYGTAGSTGGVFSGLITVTPGASSATLPSPFTVISTSGGTAGGSGGVNSGLLSGTSVATLATLVSSLFTSFGTAGASSGLISGALTPGSLLSSQATVVVNSFGTGGSTGGFTGGIIPGQSTPGSVLSSLATIQVSSFGTGFSTGSAASGLITPSSLLSSLPTSFTTPNLPPSSQVSGGPPISVLSTTFGTAGSTGGITSGLITPGTLLSSTLPTDTPPINPPNQLRSTRSYTTVVSGVTTVIVTTETFDITSYFTGGSTGGITGGSITGPTTTILASSSVTVPTLGTVLSSSFGTFGSSGGLTSGLLSVSSPSSAATSSTTATGPPPFTGFSYPGFPPVIPTTSTSSGPPTSTPTFDSNLRTPGTFPTTSSSSLPGFTGPSYPGPPGVSSSSQTSFGTAGSSSGITSGPLTISTSASVPVSSTNSSSTDTATFDTRNRTPGGPPSSSSSLSSSSSSTGTATFDTANRTPGGPPSSSSSLSSSSSIPQIPVYPGPPGYYYPYPPVPTPATSSSSNSDASFTSGGRTGQQFPPTSTTTTSSTDTMISSSSSSDASFTSGGRTGQQFPPTSTDTTSIPFTGLQPPTGGSTSSPPFVTSIGSTNCTLGTTTIFTTVTLYGCYSQCSAGGYIPPQAFGAGPGR